MFFFLSLREHNSRIEPDILPISSASSQVGLVPETGTGNTIGKAARYQGSTFQDYITRWDLSDWPAILRKCICTIALFLHLPINLISILSYGVSLWMFLGIILSLLNLACVGIGLWKLDVMRGQRLFYNKILKRHHFDYIILFLLLTYGGFFGTLLFAKLRLRSWIYFFRFVWPCVIAADLVCFVAGWVATWRDITVG